LAARHDWSGRPPPEPEEQPDLAGVIGVVDRDVEQLVADGARLAGAAAAEPVLVSLKRAAGHLRHELAGRVALRIIPELRFHFDTSVERGDRLARLIDQARREDQTGKDK
jgi:hypothetical protein